MPDRAPAAPERIVFAGAAGRLVADRWAAEEPAGTVLLLHGGGQTRHSWARTSARLAAGARDGAAGWTAVAIDSRGHGDSDWAPDGDYSLGSFVSDLEAVVAASAPPIVLVGASLGGMTSLTVAGRHPDLIAGLVLVDVVVTLQAAGVDRIRRFMTATPDGFATLEEASDAIAAYNPNRPRPASLDGLRKNLRRRADGRWHWHWDPAFMQIDDEPQRRIGRVGLREAAAAIRCPVLIVRGRNSDVVSDAGIEDMRALVPQAEVADVSQAGHMVAGDDNDVFAQALEGFLRRVTDDGASSRE